MEEFAISKFPKFGKCPKSPFMIGWHRVGIIPVISWFDNGSSGDSAREIFLECGRWFKQRWFIAKKQPDRIGG